MSDVNMGLLYVVATPIGNLHDMVPRAVDVLQKVDVIAAEDTRHSGRLLQHFGISTRLLAYHEHSNEQRRQQLVALLLSGQSVALISDAGTPLIADPGYQLVSAARAQGITVIPIPGACALIAALSVSGLSAGQFVFDGFLPAKTSARCKALTLVKQEYRTVIFYESPHRIVDTLQDMQTVLGEQRHVVVARELTKTYETVFSGTLNTVAASIVNHAQQQKGEFVILIKGCEKITDRLMTPAAETLMQKLLPHVPAKTAASIVASVTDIHKRDLYQWALDNKRGADA